MITLASGASHRERVHVAERMAALPPKPDLAGQVLDCQQCATTGHPGGGPSSSAERADKGTPRNLPFDTSGNDFRTADLCLYAASSGSHPVLAKKRDQHGRPSLNTAATAGVSSTMAALTPPRR